MSEYERILRGVQTLGYQFKHFTEPPDAGLEVFLRHDVDNCVQSAYRMALAEHALGVKSTYLFLLRSENYNVWSKYSITAIRKIAELNHAIGLHFSLVDHADSAAGKLLPQLVLEDAAHLSAAIGMPMRVFAFHNPMPEVDYKLHVPGLINAYDAAFFSGAKYLSESNMRWRDGDPLHVLTTGRHRRCQILVHPLTFADDLTSDAEVLLHFLHLKVRQLKSYNELNNYSLMTNPIPMGDVLAYLQRGASHDE